MKDTVRKYIVSKIKNIERSATWLQSKYAFLIGYLLIFTLFFLKIIKGAGQNWDWLFPYFQSSISNYFTRQSLSWTETQSGTPLSYNSDYFARFVISQFHFLQPEILLFLIFVTLFSFGAFGVFLISQRHTQKYMAFLLGLVAFINPAIFYNYTAGYIDYFVSLVIFIYLLYYVLYKFKRNLYSAMVIGLMLGLVGAQLQFLVIAPIYLALLFAFDREKLSWRYVPIICGLPVLINLVWLSNFLVGASSLADASATAGKLSHNALSSTSFLSIFGFSFSRATLISRYYDAFELLVYFALFAGAIALVVAKRRLLKQELALVILLIGLVFLATGEFQVINLGPLTMLYPMFREIGHFAPVFVLTLLLLLGRLMQQGRLKLVFVAILTICIVTSWYKFQSYPQNIDYSAMRSALGEFQTFSQTNKAPESRVLSYPFFDQYSIKEFGLNKSSHLPMRNVGYDSFEAFAPTEFITNQVAPQNFQDSVQYKLLTTHDISILRPYNVRYIYDLSDIWESEYNRYVPGSTYNNDLSLIKNNPNFLNDLIAANPNKLRRVSKNVLEIVDYAPHVAAAKEVFALQAPSQVDPATRKFVTQTLNSHFDYTVKDTGTPYEINFTRLFDAVDAHSSFNLAEKSIEQTVQPPDTKHEQLTLYSNPNQYDAFYNMQGNKLVIYELPTGQLLIDNNLLKDNIGSTPKILLKANLVPGQRYVLAIAGVITQLHQGANIALGPVSSGTHLQLLSLNSSNLIQNPSFEQGLWQKSVSDCSNYDDNPEISMNWSKEASEGQNSLELNATRHNACLSSNIFKLQPNEQYLLSYDYQSPAKSVASFYIGFNNSDATPAKGSQATNDTAWHHAVSLFQAPTNATFGKLTLYALESDQRHQNTLRYDNLNLVTAKIITDTITPSENKPYVKQELANTGKPISFIFQDPDYSYQNLIKNPSFEEGPWQDSVSDCANYDDNPKISMNLSNQASVGQHALELNAARHNACTYTSADVKGGGRYLLSFDYQGKNTPQAGYNIAFNDPKATANDQHINITKDKWNTYNTEIQVPEGASTATLYFYAFESDSKTQNTVRYDNVRLVELPDFSSRYFITSMPTQQLAEPESITFRTINITKRTVLIKKASKPFILTLSETYNPKWRLELNNNNVTGLLNSWWPFAKGQIILDHFKLSDYANGWYIDPAKLCSAKPLNGCSRNADGSYDIDLIAEFAPQRWFNISLITSSSTLLACISCLFYCWRRKRQDDKNQDDTDPSSSGRHPNLPYGGPGASHNTYGQVRRVKRNAKRLVRL